MNIHENFMLTALELAEKGRGFVEPNPMVGAVVVKDGKIIGKGYHQVYGSNHAEINAINDAGANCKGSDLYVTLEPCSHFGKTPPCAEAVKRAEFKRVIIAVSDPNPISQKSGVEILKEAGIEVVEGILEDKARCLNAPFFKWITTKLPFVTAKWAMTFDGKIATRTGDSKWISNEESRLYVHKIRGEMDAIMVGIKTAIADDPLLTCRTEAKRVAKRVVIDNNASLPLDSQLVKTVKDAEVIVVTSKSAPEESIKKLEMAGCKVLKANLNDGRIDLMSLLKELGKMDIINVMVEGGGKLFGSLFDEKLVDKVVMFVSPKIIGDTNALSPVSGTGIHTVAQSVQFDHINVSQFSEDIVIEAVVKT